jgi:arginase family enzyme
VLILDAPIVRTLAPLHILHIDARRDLCDALDSNHRSHAPAFVRILEAAAAEQQTNRSALRVDEWMK